VTLIRAARPRPGRPPPAPAARRPPPAAHRPQENSSALETAAAMGRARVRAAPVDAIELELELGALWL